MWAYVKGASRATDHLGGGGALAAKSDRSKQQLFFRNTTAFETTLLLFATFVSFGCELRYTITDPLFGS